MSAVVQHLKSVLLFSMVSVALFPAVSRGADPTPDNATPTPLPTASPTATETPRVKGVRPPETRSSIAIHKKLLPPAWGQVVQFRKYETKAFSEKNRETLYEFVLQDAQGIVRVATFHENPDGDGYWEVLTWDNP